VGKILDGISDLIKGNETEEVVKPVSFGVEEKYDSFTSFMDEHEKEVTAVETSNLHEIVTFNKLIHIHELMRLKDEQEKLKQDDAFNHTMGKGVTQAIWDIHFKNDESLRKLQVKEKSINKLMDNQNGNNSEVKDAGVEVDRAFAAVLSKIDPEVTRVCLESRGDISRPDSPRPVDILAEIVSCISLKGHEQFIEEVLVLIRKYEQKKQIELLDI